MDMDTPETIEASVRRMLANTDEKPLEIAFTIDARHLEMIDARTTLEFIAGILRDKGFAFSGVITSSRS
jgi:hypothetical protein